MTALLPPLIPTKNCGRPVCGGRVTTSVWYVDRLEKELGVMSTPLQETIVDELNESAPLPVIVTTVLPLEEPMLGTRPLLVAIPGPLLVNEVGELMERAETPPKVRALLDDCVCMVCTAFSAAATLLDSTTATLVTTARTITSISFGIR